MRQRDSLNPHRFPSFAARAIQPVVQRHWLLVKMSLLILSQMINTIKLNKSAGAFIINVYVMVKVSREFRKLKVDVQKLQITKVQKCSCYFF